jgi:hypothetical protein
MARQGPTEDLTHVSTAVRLHTVCFLDENSDTFKWMKCMRMKLMHSDLYFLLYCTLNIQIHSRSVNEL